MKTQREQAEIENFTSQLENDSKVLDLEYKNIFNINDNQKNPLLAVNPKKTAVIAATPRDIIAEDENYKKEILGGNRKISENPILPPFIIEKIKNDHKKDYRIDNFDNRRKQQVFHTSALPKEQPKKFNMPQFEKTPLPRKIGGIFLGVKEKEKKIELPKAKAKKSKKGDDEDIDKYFGKGNDDDKSGDDDLSDTYLE